MKKHDEIVRRVDARVERLVFGFANYLANFRTIFQRTKALLP